MANYLSLEEAAAKLGIGTERLVELRSQGQVRGFRDGASWKFPDTEIDRLADDLQDLVGGSGFGSGIMSVDESVGSAADSAIPKEDSSDLQIGAEDLVQNGSDVNLVATDDSPGSDVALVASKSSSGPGSSALELDLEEDSGDELIINDSSLDVLDEDDLASGAGSASNLELLAALDEPAGSKSSDSSADVLGDLDLLSTEQSGSGLISGVGSGSLAGASGVGSDLSLDMDSDDELVIADVDDDLVIDSAGSDISVAGDSGINLMSPSDSGLSLESEPLDLAGSSISALDLGAEIGSGSGSGSGASDGSGSAIDFQADEEFQLSPSGIGLDTDEDSGSQVIEVDDSEVVGEAVEFGDAGFGGDDVFAEDAEVAEPMGLGDEDALSLDAGDPMAPAAAAAATAGPIISFDMIQVVCLALVACTLALCGMIATDLVRNMWAYAEPSSPVSGLTNMLIGLLGMNP